MALGSLGDLVLALSADTVKFQSDLGKAHRVSRKFATDVGEQFRMLGRAMASLGGAAGVGLLTKSLFEAGTTMDRFRIAFEAAAGSAAEGAQNLGFVHGLSQELGISFVETATAFQKFSAAVEGSSLEGEQARKIFTSFAGAARVLGSSAQDTGLIFLALEQMVSKGKVSTEELRRQLGERLPGAFRLAAEALGVTTADLDKMLRAGSITAEDLLPKLARRVEQVYGKAVPEASQMAIAELERLKNEWLEVKAVIAADSGFMSTVSEVLRTGREGLGAVESAAGAIKVVLQTIMVLGANVKFVMKGIGTEIGGIAAQLAALATLDFGGFKAIREAMLEDAARSRAELDAFEQRLLGVHKALKTAEGGAMDMGVGLVEMWKKGAQPLRDLEKEAKEAEKRFKALKEAIMAVHDDAMAAAEADQEISRRQAEALKQSAQDHLDMVQAATIDEKELADRIQDNTVRFEDLDFQLQLTDRSASDFGFTFNSQLEEMIINGGEARDVIRALGQDLARMVVRRSITEPLGRGVDELLKGVFTQNNPGGPTSGIFTGGTFAEGGRPPLGKISLVGEKGPELFIPDVAGSIVPGDELGGVTINNVVNISGSGVTPADVRHALALNQKQTIAAVQELRRR